MEGPPRVEVLLDDGEEVAALVAAAVRGGLGAGFEVDEGVGEGFVGGHALLRVDGEAALDELAGGEGDGAPVFERGEGVVGDEDGLHFFEVGVPVEGGVAAEEEVCYYSYGPHVAVGRGGGEYLVRGEKKGEGGGSGGGEFGGVGRTLVSRGLSS